MLASSVNTSIYNSKENLLAFVRGCPVWIGSNKAGTVIPDKHYKRSLVPPLQECQEFFNCFCLHKAKQKIFFEEQYACLHLFCSSWICCVSNKTVMTVCWTFNWSQLGAQLGLNTQIRVVGQSLEFPLGPLPPPRIRSPVFGSPPNKTQILDPRVRRVEIKGSS